MNRTRAFAALIALLFVTSVGIGVALGWNDRPRDVATAERIASSSTTTVAPTTTTRAPATTVAPTTTVPRPTTTRKPLPAVIPTTPPPTISDTTTPPPTDPPTTTTTPPPTTPPTLGYNPVDCVRINQLYADAPDRVVILQAAGCPPAYWDAI